MSREAVRDSGILSRVFGWRPGRRWCDLGSLLPPALPGRPERKGASPRVRYAVAIYRAPVGNGWCGQCFDLDVHVAGASRAEAVRRLQQALAWHWRELRRTQQPAPAPVARVAYLAPGELP